MARRVAAQGARDAKVWVETTEKDVIAAALERGIASFLFPSGASVETLQQMGTFETLTLKDANGEAEAGRVISDATGEVVASLFRCGTADEVRKIARVATLESEMQGEEVVVIDCTEDWKVIPAENIIAAFEGSGRRCMAVAGTAEEAQTFLEALEVGTDGVVLRSDDVSEVIRLCEWLDVRHKEGQRLEIQEGKVTKIASIGMADRACIDVCSLLQPGEGMLVGSFAEGMVLVHSECLECGYVASRPFRVNAGAVHSYVQCPGDKTAYLSELRSGDQVLVSDGEGNARTVIVGRVKIEARPMMLIEVEAPHAERCFTLIVQNAETVRLCAAGMNASIAVTSLKVGDKLALHCKQGARHTGLIVSESTFIER